MRKTTVHAASRHRRTPACSALSCAIGQALHTRPVRRRAPAAMLLAALALTVPTVQAQSTQWLATGSSDWYDEDNWTAGVPDENTDVVVADTSGSGYPMIYTGIAYARDLTFTSNYMQISSGGVFNNRNSTVRAELAVLNGSWHGARIVIGNSSASQASVRIDEAGSITADAITLGESAGEIGTISVDGNRGFIDVAGQLTVGDAGDGYATVSGNAELSAGSVVLGAQQTGYGSMHVDRRGHLYTGTLTVGAAGEGELVASNDATVTADWLDMGVLEGSEGGVQVVGGSSVDIAHDVNVGVHGNGWLQVEGGSRVSAGVLMMADEEGSRGDVVVTGQGSSLEVGADIVVGARGEGRLEVLDSATVNAFRGFIGGYDVGTPGVTSSALVQGAGSTWNVDIHFYVGHLADGELEIADGGVVNVAESSYLGNEAGSKGTVSVHGAGSRWNNSGAVVVGYSGWGSLSVTDGGVVNSNEGSVGDLTLTDDGAGYHDTRGSALIEGAGSRWNVAGDFRVGQNDGVLTVRGGGVLATDDADVGLLYSELLDAVPGTRAEVLVDGAGSSWESTGTITVGLNDKGLLDVRNGAVVSSVGGIIGRDVNVAGNAGLVRIDGAGSQWNTSGGLSIGGNGRGRLEVGNQGAVQAGSTVLGANVDSAGELLVDGAESRFAGGGIIIVGQLGQGSASVRNRATVSSDHTAIGAGQGSRGQVSVEGAGSSWTSLGNMVVGFIGRGRLEVGNQGAVQAGSTMLGVNAVGVGELLVDGAGSRLDNSDLIVVGQLGQGSATVRNRATVSSDQAVIGGGQGGRGQVSVEGAGSSWTSQGAMVVGNGGRGEFTVKDGGRATSAQTLVLAQAAGSAGVVNIGAGGASGTLEVPEIAGGAGDASVNFNHRDDIDFGVHMTGSLGVNKLGGGTTTLIADNDYAGGTFVGEGVLQLGNGGETGSLVGDVQVDAGATLAFNRANAYQFEWDILGAGSVHQRGSGTTTFVQDQTYTGGTRIRDGVLQLGNGGSTGSLVGDVETEGDGTLAFNRSNAYDFLGSIGGTGNVHQIGTGTTTFRGTGTYTGATEVRSGTVLVEGALGDTRTTVYSGATLGGTGRIGGEVIVNDGGILAPGTSPGTLTVGGLQLAAGALLEYELGQAGVIGSGINDLIEIDGDLILDGTLNVTDAGGFGVGVYRLMNYGGSLTDNVLDLGTLPTGVEANDLFVQTAIAGQVNLVNSAGISVNFWDGAAGPTDDGVIQGGNGVWVSNDRSWTLPDGSLNGHWNEGFAVFGGQAGTVTVLGEQRFTGMQFMTDGYRLEPGTDAALRASGTTSLRVDPGVTATIAAPIVGDAMLVKVDEGTLVLEGEFGYTGGVTVNGGRLVGDTGNLLGDILNRAELEFAQHEDATYAGLISGSGQLIKSADGVLTLTGTNTYTGGTRIEAGTLRIGNGGTAGSIVGDVQIDADGAFAFDRSDSFSFDGAFSGTGLFDKFGDGTLTLTGNSAAYVGHGTLRDGRLHMLGTVGGQFDVLAGTVLSGTGTLGTVDNAGTISPGGSIGTLHMTGDFVHRERATYNVDIAPDGTSDLLDIAGGATIEGGEVYVTKVPGQYAGGRRYTIVDAEGGVTGTYATLDQNLPFLDMFLSYDPNHVYLDIRRNDTDFSSLCGRGTFNQCQVAGALDRISRKDVITPDLQTVLSEVTTLDADTALESFDRMSGEAHASLAGIMLEGHALFGQTVTRRLADRRETVGATRLQGGSWVRAYGADTDLGSDGNAYGADYRLHGVAVGYDAWGTEHWLIGASANLMRVDADFRPGDKAEADAKNVSIYTSFRSDRAYLDGVASFAWWDSDVTRAVDVGTIHRTAESNYGSNRLAVYLEGGWKIALADNQMLQPFATYQHDVFDVERFGEQGAQDLDILSHAQGGERSTAGLGLRWSGTFQRGAWTIEPTAQARWLHTMGDRTVQLDLAYEGARDVSHLVRGATFPENRGVLGLGLAARKDRLDLFLDYDDQRGDGFRAHTLGAGLRYRW